MAQALWVNSLALSKSKLYLPHEPVTPLLAITGRNEILRSRCKDLSGGTAIAALFVITPN